jgi:flagellar secretion chaperone FliS
MMNGTQGLEALRNQYNREAVLSATPARLLTMLYDRLLLDLGRAERAQQSQNWAVASENLIHAQAIVAELSSSLKLDAWDGAKGLFELYTFVSTALVEANIRRDAERTRACITLLEPLRDAWHQAAGELVPAAPVAAARTGGFLGVA